MLNDNRFYVYVHISKKTDLPFYVGFGQNYRISIKSRRSQEWNEIVEKEDYYYGFLRKNMYREEANLFEKFCIKFFIEIGFNLVNKINGGSGNSKRKPYSDEYKKVIANRSRIFWNSATQEYKKFFGQKMSDLLKGKKKPDRSLEHCENQSLSHKGQTPWNKGKSNIYSEETLQKIREGSNSKKIEVYNNEGIFLYKFTSISEASRNLNIGRLKISRILSKEVKNKTNFIFKYGDEGE
jgi:hypothetical protein